MKNLYKGECGYVLRRGKLTRSEFALAKVEHANRGNEGHPCFTCADLLTKSRAAGAKH
jgi:hypothetical protein